MSFRADSTLCSEEYKCLPKNTSEEAPLEVVHDRAYCRQIDSESPLDRWISYAVKVLRDGGIETDESCQGGRGHSYREPAVRFLGTSWGEGLRAVAIAQTFGLPVRALHRFWSMNDDELTGSYWELAFWERPLKRLQREAERTGLIT